VPYSRYQEAAAIYAELLRARGPDAALYHNLGNCAYARGDYTAAVLYYERARYLAPGLRAAAHNLAMTRRRLALPPERAPATVSEAVYHGLIQARRRTWLCALGVACAAFFAVLAWCRWRRRWRAVPIACAALALVLVGLGTYLNHRQRSTRAVVLLAGPQPLYLFPGDTAVVVAELPAGTVARYEDRSRGWQRLAYEQYAGWVPQAQVATVWPPEPLLYEAPPVEEEPRM